MSVLHVAAGHVLGGIESALEALAVTPGPLDQEFAVFFDGPLADRLRELGARVHILGPVRVRRPWTVVGARRRLAALLRVAPGSVVLAHGGWSYGIVAAPARRLGVVRVLYAHAPPVANWVDRWASWSRPDLLVTNSDFTLRAYAGVYPGLDGVTVRPGVPPPPRLDPAARAALRASLGVAPTDVVIALVGRLDPCKGHRVYIDALGRLGRERPWRAWIIGGAQTDDERALEAWLREMATAPALAGRLSCLGLRRDARALLAAADVYCQPNATPDAFGITFVEALHAGLPVVTSALGGALEIVDPSCGALVSPGDAAAVASVLRELIDEPTRRATLGGAGPARAAVLCDPARQAERLERALAGVERATRP